MIEQHKFWFYLSALSTGAFFAAVTGQQTPPLPVAPAHSVAWTNDSPMWPKPVKARVQHPSGITIDTPNAVRILIPDGYALTNVPLVSLNAADLAQFKRSNEWAMVFYFVRKP